MKQFQLKRKHHYVWAYYLKGWAEDEKNVWYISKKGNPSFDSVRGIGCEKHFYKVGAVSKGDIELMKLWLSGCSAELRSLHLQLIDIVCWAQNKAKNLNDIALSKLNVDLNELISNNLFENYMSSQENSAVDVMKKLRVGDLTCLDDKEERWQFSYYMGYQFSRTKRMRDALIYSVKISPFDESVKVRWLDFYSKHWWFVCSFIGTNLSKDIALNENRKIKILTNHTDKSFITSDQPVVNLNPDGKDGENIDYYYPISSDRALLILNSGLIDFCESITDANDVDFLNKKIASFAGDTIFAVNKEALLAYKNEFNKREYKFP
ncbi:DUF4238 domain-containing protein [Cedecea sp. FDAARGOS_727]|uniref:DUF4238 domain-containing protein n=1 Tax=Cedecea sp. FDAARGOS_727 TaxID=2545798 RepID=UPI00143EA916|nr:DUF4238 domain-containing protein [Cedecea sp. FDAARGOS_727]QIX94182.1 DUF4238 domain-containing protein [Cedecea sp. FDAARGOS_727]QIX98301.1 DUF4238 domain-containing protein [Cedecea sp. FDAARGOS_727]